jgi:chlorophyll(ide) b reductase
VTKYTDVAALSSHVDTVFDGARIDHWINNAGLCEGPRELGEVSFEEIDDVVNTNVLGVIYCSKVASKLGARNIYMVSGHGSDGRKTPGFAVYGATKAAVSQFTATFADEMKECREGTGVGVHILAPGIMKTELSRKLLQDDTMPPLNKWVFSVIAVEPEVVAERLVPKILSVKGTGKTLWGFV